MPSTTTPATVRAHRAFSLIELLVVISIIAILIGLLLPVLSAAKQRSYKVACSSNLKQIGYAVQMYRDQNGGTFPVARYMPPPFLSGDPSPPLNKALDSFISASLGRDNEAYHCYADMSVFKLSGSSYSYETQLSGQKMEGIRRNRQLSEIVVVRDFDGGVFDLQDGTSIVVPSFHDLRNLLFADGHAGNFQ
ncbi:MAG: prepilin-type N-terminal cleavage/methylation domain-containing protein [Planctomycetes bacterium]|nr:prepilin-type N-terminal cleavage/methylation domain-containing protein [Planctomycetota bacterium]